MAEIVSCPIFKALWSEEGPVIQTHPHGVMCLLSYRGRPDQGRRRMCNLPGGVGARRHHRSSALPLHLPQRVQSPVQLPFHSILHVKTQMLVFLSG